MTAATVLCVEKGRVHSHGLPLHNTYTGIYNHQCLWYNLVFLFVSIGYQPYSRLGGYSTIGTISA